MLIQPLLFPPQSFINEPELFFRGIESQNILEDRVSVPAGSTVSFETYFNAFSVGKWVEYSKINNLSLHLEIQGEVEIKAFHAVGTVDAEFFAREHNKYPEQELIKRINERSYSATSELADYSQLKNNDDYTVTFNRMYKDGIIYVTIKAIDDAIFYGGYYSTEINEEELNPVKLAVGICTFRREQAVKSNVERIITEIIDNPQSPLADKIEVYIADNGQTLKHCTFGNSSVHLFPNPNLGGSGGFARTMIEAMFYDKAKDFSHIIFMDDDIFLYPAVLERTFYLLRLLKEEYKKAIIGSSQFLVDKKSIQYENGALYRDTTTYIGRSNHKFFDMKYPGAVVANEVINKVNYTGWWYACIPKAIATESNLPMPFFIHYDDAEYSIRNIKNGLIFINGICVWHPAPVNKGPFWITYYNTRNRLITMFSRGVGRKNFVKYILAISKMFLFHITRYEYKRAALIQKGMKDFLKGSAAFVGTDALSLHENLLENKITYITPEEAEISRNSIINYHHKNFLIAGLTQLFCNLLPAKDKVLAVDGKYFNIPYRAKKLYIYDDKIDKGYVLERNQKTFWGLLFSYIATIWNLFGRFNSLSRDWQAAKPTLTSLSFWEKYLGLNKN